MMAQQFRTTLTSGARWLSGLWRRRSTAVTFILGAIVAAVISAETDILWSGTKEWAREQIVKGEITNLFAKIGPEVIVLLDQDDDKPDVTFLVCENVHFRTDISEILRIQQPINPEGSPVFGSAKVQIISPDWSLARLLRDHVTIVYDREHDERLMVGRVMDWVIQADKFADVQIVANGPEAIVTGWRYSVFIC